jgi:tRNA-binding protein
MTEHAAQPFKEPGTATIDDFRRIDMRVGRIVTVEPFPRARKPAYQLTIDFGPVGTRR